jgi:hypothetical protein
MPNPTYDFVDPTLQQITSKRDLAPLHPHDGVLAKVLVPWRFFRRFFSIFFDTTGYQRAARWPMDLRQNFAPWIGSRLLLVAQGEPGGGSRRAIQQD